MTNRSYYGKASYEGRTTVLAILVLLVLTTYYLHWAFSKTDEKKALTISHSPTGADFSVGDRGYWQGLGAKKYHAFDPKLAAGIVKFFKQENATTILELGAGVGEYAKLMKSEGLFVSCYDGNPKTQELTTGRCAVVDLSIPVEFSRYDWVLSLEVGEHIPGKYEDIFLSNLDKGNAFGIILSWAVEGQGGTAHVNNRNNSYVRNKLEGRGYQSDVEVEKMLRSSITWAWFKNTVMVFRRINTAG